MYKSKNFTYFVSLVLASLLLVGSLPLEAAKFSDNVAVSSTSADELHPDIAVDHAGNLFVAWEVAANGWDINYCKSVDSGATFTTAATINSTTVPTAGSATADNAGGSLTTTLATACAIYATVLDLTSILCPSSGSGIIDGTDEFTYTGVNIDNGWLTGCSGVDSAYGAPTDVVITWASGASVIGNGSLSVAYVGPWISAGTVTATFSSGADTWTVSGVASGATTTGATYSFPTVGASPDSYTMNFSISTGSIAWANGDRFTFSIAQATSSAYQILPAITADDNQISYFAWTDTRVASGVYDVYADQTGLYTGDKYISKLTDQIANPGETIYDIYSIVENASDIAMEKYLNVKQVYTVWAEGDATGTHIWSRASTDEGQTFLPLGLSNTGTQVDDDEDPADICIQPSLGVIGRNDDNVQKLYVVFHNYTDDKIRYTSSTDGGGSWGGDTLNVSDDTGVAQPDIAVSDTDANGTPDIYAVWRQSASGTDNIYFARLPAGEAAFTTPVRINASTDKVQDSPSITVNPTNGNLYVVWRDEKTGESDIYFSQSFDSGATWGVDLNDNGNVTDSGENIDLVVNDDTGYAVQNHPKIVADAYGHVYVVWEDARSGSSYDIYSARLVAGSFGGGPAAPSSLSAVGSDGAVNLTWTASTSADIVSYSVYRSTARGSWSSTATASSIVTTNYMDTGVTNGTAYWYVVTAINASGQESVYSNDARATPNVIDLTAPNAPTGLAVTAGNTQIALAWTASTSADVSSYHVYRSIVSASSYYYVGSTSSPVLSYLNSSLANGTKYYYVVTALDTSNNESADSNEASATTTGSYTPGGGTPPGPAPGGSGGGPGGGCFIATAAFGTPFAREVQILSNFRDKCLLENMPGQLFVKTYYKISPHIAEFIRNKPLAKKIIRLYLRPAVFAAGLLVSDDKVR